MAYTVLARRYRSQTFDDVIGQDPIAQTLKNAIKTGRVAHAYLFTGTRGVGKTTMARILAKSLNCLAADAPTMQPCCKCDSCIAINAGDDIDVIEIDGASNNSVEEVRRLRENAIYRPARARFKIYIIDEVHMLTQEAFNALLKTLEEPPSHVIFIFATTAPHKVPPTILSRCQRFDFKAVPTMEILARLEQVLTAEGISMPAEVMGIIARKADGAMRDALSLLDQVIAFCGGDYTVKKAAQVLGILDVELFFELTGLIKERRTADVVNFVEHLADSGVDLEDFYGELVRHYRNLIVFKLGEKVTAAAEISPVHAGRYAELARDLEFEDLVRSLQLILGFEEMIRYSGQQKISLELLLVRLTLLKKSVNISEILSKLEGGPGTIFKTSAEADSTSVPGRKAKIDFQESQSSPLSVYSGGVKGEKPATPDASPLSAEKEAAQSSGIAPKTGEKSSGAGSPGAEEGLPAGGRDGAVDLETIKKFWPNIVQKVKNKKISLGHALGSLEPGRLEGKTLVLKIDSKLTYYRDRLKDTDCSKLIGEVIKEYFGLEALDLQIEAGEIARVENLPESGDTEHYAAAPSFGDLCRTNPVMGKIKELFNPELLS